MLAELLLLCVYVCVCETAACAYTRGVETAELLGGKIPLADLDYREVRLEIDADNRRVSGAASRCENRVAGDGPRGVGGSR